MLSIDSPNFQPTSDYIFVHADKDKGSQKVLPNGQVLYIATKWRPTDRGIATQDGVVRYVPMRLTNKKPIEVAVGDKVIFHHSVCDDANQVEVNGEILYHALYEHAMFCKIVDGKITMLNDRNFVEPIDVPEKSSLIITPDMAKKKSHNTGIIRHVNKGLDEQGVRAGDKIVFTKNSDYDIDVEGTMYYCMKNNDIVAIIESQ